MSLARTGAIYGALTTTPARLDRREQNEGSRRGKKGIVANRRKITSGTPCWLYTVHRSFPIGTLSQPVEREGAVRSRTFLHMPQRGPSHPLLLTRPSARSFLSTTGEELQTIIPSGQSLPHCFKASRLPDGMCHHPAPGVSGAP